MLRRRRGSLVAPGRSASRVLVRAARWAGVAPRLGLGRHRLEAGCGFDLEPSWALQPGSGAQPGGLVLPSSSRRGHGRCAGGYLAQPLAGGAMPEGPTPAQIWDGVGAAEPERWWRPGWPWPPSSGRGWCLPRRVSSPSRSRCGRTGGSDGGWDVTSLSSVFMPAGGGLGSSGRRGGGLGWRYVGLAFSDGILTVVMGACFGRVGGEICSGGVPGFDGASAVAIPKSCSGGLV